MSNEDRTEDFDLDRRNALKRLGLAAGAAYIAPAFMSLSSAHASSGSSGGGDGGDGGDSSSGSDSSDGSDASDASDASEPSEPSEPSDDEQASAATGDGSVNPIQAILNVVGLGN